MPDRGGDRLPISIENSCPVVYLWHCFACSSAILYAQRLTYRPEVGLQMGEDSDSFYIIEEGTVSVEASFVDIPLAQRAVSFPVNVASPSNGWCGSVPLLSAPARRVLPCLKAG